MIDPLAHLRPPQSPRRVLSKTAAVLALVVGASLIGVAFQPGPTADEPGPAPKSDRLPVRTAVATSPTPPVRGPAWSRATVACAPDCITIVEKVGGGPSSAAPALDAAPAPDNRLVGAPVLDAEGRAVGRVASVAAGDAGDLAGVMIAFDDGSRAAVPASRLWLSDLAEGPLVRLLASPHRDAAMSMDALRSAID